MIGTAIEVYRATRKKHDLLFNLYLMRPIAALVVVVFGKTPITPNQVTLLNLAIFIVAAALFIALPTFTGGLIAVLVLEVSYCLDCVDGMLARHKKIASKEGHLFDFFTDEMKAILLAASIPIRLWRSGGYAPGLRFPPPVWEPDDARFLFAAIAGAVIVASATSFTNFWRRPELTGKATTVEAHYETVEQVKPKSLVGKVASLVGTFLRFLNHYPSHLWIFALAGRLDVFFWMYIALNGAYLGLGWLKIVRRFGRG
ncbi:MAG: CDP-alcohol phosphatidyltransferase family protein [Labilithrix sp.]|nr:CDP-alcohol phosphatidyltransferase family protein [Labilithrix sp.]MCW5811062.1 CDP-alcohol phosphatidyltransferase family protein [Labilithrix sp.]